MKLNKEHAAALRAALPFLWDGQGADPERDGEKVRFICRALERTDHPCSADVIREIERRLLGHTTLYFWLAAEHGVSEAREQDPGSLFEQIQAHRCAWMLLMIEEGES